LVLHFFQTAHGLLIPKCDAASDLFHARSARADAATEKPDAFLPNAFSGVIRIIGVMAAGKMIR
jgi:hypothetical protein